MKVGIIGLGAFGQRRLKALEACGDTLVYSCDPMRDNFGDIANAEAVIVATPHDMLSPNAIECLRAGKPVLLEKPCGLNLAEVQAVADTAREIGVACVPGFTLRHYPGLIAAHDAVHTKRYGEVLYLRAVYGHGGKLANWHLDAKRGGGVLLDLGVHLVDLSLWLGLPIPEAAKTIPQDPDLVITACPIVGGRSIMCVSWQEWRPTFRLEVICERGGITVEGLGGAYGPHRASFFRQWGTDETIEYGDCRERSMIAEWEAFKEVAQDASIRDNFPSVLAAIMTTALDAMRVIERVRG